MATNTKQVHVPREFRGRDVAASTGRFLWHFVQMIVAMMLGMGLYHLLTGKALAAYPVLNFAGMELSMIPPMVALMLYQRHGWRCSAEMVGAMLVGPAVFLACAQFGLHNYIPGLSRETLFGLSDATMYLGMLGAMLYRREMYTRPHAGHQHASASAAATAHTIRVPTVDTSTTTTLSMTPRSADSIEVSFGITGMTCASCVRKIETSLKKVDGVERAQVNLATERATVRYNPTKADLPALAAAVERAGYSAKLPEAAAVTAAPVPQQLVIPITGMTCASCVHHVEQAIGKVPGIESVKVNLGTERAMVRGVIDIEAIRRAVEAAGYGIGKVASQAVVSQAAGQDTEQLERAREARDKLIRASVSRAIGVPMMIAMLVQLPIERRMLYYLFFAFATPVQFWAGWSFYKGAWQALRHGSMNMNTLVAAGTTVAYLFSVFVTFCPASRSRGAWRPNRTTKAPSLSSP